MKGQHPIVTVADLKKYLNVIPDDAQISIMPNEGGSDGFRIEEVLVFNASEPKEVWFVVDEPRDAEDEYVSGPADDDEEPSEEAAYIIEVPREEEDVVQIRGKLKSA